MSLVALSAKKEQNRGFINEVKLSKIIDDSNQRKIRHSRDGSR